MAIQVGRVSKKFCRRLRHTMLYGGSDIMRSTLGLSSCSDQLRSGEFWALDDISFEVKPGETLGIIGPNGSGKTTILKLLNGIFMPDKGEIRIKGRVGALIEVGAGFHPLLTGRENIYINGTILGMSKREIDKKFDSIADFADIGDFLDSPVKHYSTGMYARLGFAIAIHCEPDILLIDEVLAVGDIDFQNKSFQRLIELREKASVIFISHNMGAIGTVCDKVIWLNKGKVILYEDTKTVISQYVEDYFKRVEKDVQRDWVDGDGEKSIRSLQIERVELLNKQGNVKDKHISGEDLIICIEYYSAMDYEKVSFILHILSSRSDEVIFSASEISKAKFYNMPKGGGKIICRFKCPPLLEGIYRIGLTIFPARGYFGILYKNRNLKTFRVDEEFGPENLAVDKHMAVIGTKGLIKVPYILEVK